MPAKKSTNQRRPHPGQFQPGQSGNPKGRPKGKLNKVTQSLKDMILEALENKGGAAYLQEQAEENPGAFLALLGKILPREMVLEGGERVPVIVIRDYSQKASPDPEK